MKIGYGKIGRSMPLTLEKCANLGGDVEMVAVIREMALRHPDDEFYLLGRNTGELPEAAGLPSNVINPWQAWGWADDVRKRMAPIREKYAINANGSNLSVEGQVLARGVFDFVTRAAFMDMDAHVWWVGQHGTSNTPMPSLMHPGEWTKPQDWCAYYSSFVFQGINAWRDVDPFNREEVYLNADPRNRHKMRDLKWPLRYPILTQYDFTNNLKHERYGDPSTPWEVWGDDSWQWEKIAGTEPDPFVWTSQVRNVYSRLEINALVAGTPFGNLISFNDEWERPGHFGLIINEARAIGVRPELQRKTILRDWVLPLEPCFIRGTWSDKSLAELGMSKGAINPVGWHDYYPLLHSVRTTFTTPSSGSGWATTKPWEAFAGGTVCFFHPAYDTQDNILSDAPPGLKMWLRVSSPKELADRVAHLNRAENRATWEWIVRAQRDHVNNALKDLTYMKMLEQRIWE